MGNQSAQRLFASASRTAGRLPPAGSPGEGLPPALSHSLGAALGFDASAVRVHHDPAAARAAESVRAEAFTHGTSIYFGAGRFDPASSRGRALLVHEATHVKQHVRGGDAAGAGAARTPVSQPTEPVEVEAERAARRVTLAPGRVATGDGSRHRAQPAPAAARIYRCPTDADGNPLFEATVTIGVLWAGSELWVPAQFSVRIDEATCAWLDATPGAHPEAATQLGNVFNPEGEPTREPLSFVGGTAVGQTVARDLRRSAAAGVVDLAGTRDFVAERREVYDSAAVIEAAEAWLAANTAITTPIDWSIVLGSLDGYYPDTDEEEETTAVEESLWQRWTLFLRLVRAETVGRQGAPGATVPNGADLAESLYGYVTTADVATWGETATTHGEAFLDLWLGELTALRYVPDGFDVAVHEPSLDEAAIERERSRIVDRFLTGPPPGGGRYGQATWAEELLVGFVLDEWTVSGLSDENFLSDLDLEALRERALEHLARAFLAEARRDPTLSAALRDFAVERARWDLLRLVHGRGLALERGNARLAERLRTADITTLDGEDLAVTQDPVGFYWSQVGMAGASLNFFDRMQRGEGLEANVAQFAVESAAAVDLAVAPAGLLLLLVEFGQAVKHLQEGFATQEQEALERFRAAIDLEYDRIAKIVNGLTNLADAWIKDTWVPTLKQVAVDRLTANRDELQQRLDNWDDYAADATATYIIAAATMEQMSSDLESGELESAVIGGQVFDVTKAKDLRDAAALMRANAGALQHPVKAREKQETIQEAIDGFDETIEGVRDEDPYKPWQLGPEIFHEARARLGLGTFAFPTTFGMVLSRRVVAYDNPFIGYAIARWQYMASTRISIALFIALGLLTLAAILVPGAAGIVIGAIDLAIGLGMGIHAAYKQVSGAYAIQRMARLDLDLGVYGITVERADEIVRTAWYDAITTVLLTAGLTALGAAGLYQAGRRTYQSWRFAAINQLEKADPRLLAQLTGMTTDLRQLEGLLRTTGDARLLRDLLLHAGGDDIVRLLGRSTDARALLEVLGTTRNVRHAEALMGVVSDTPTLARLLRAPLATTEIELLLANAGIRLSAGEVQALRSSIASAHGVPGATSAQSLDAYLNAVWARRTDVLGGRALTYRIYSGATEPNPLTMGSGTYLSQARSIDTGRPAGAVFRIQDDPMRGFYRFERAGADLRAVQERIYLNVRADHAPDVMRHVVREIIDNPARFPGVEMAKLIGPGAVSRRADAIVIYTRDTRGASLVLDEVRAYRGRHPRPLRHDLARGHRDGRAGGQRRRRTARVGRWSELRSGAVQRCGVGAPADGSGGGHPRAVPRPRSGRVACCRSGPEPPAPQPARARDLGSKPVSGPPAPPPPAGDDPRLEFCLRLVEQVLAGEVTGETDEMLFEEDVVLICVRIIEQQRPRWLREQFADGRLPVDGRLLVLRDTGDLFDEGLRLLRAEDPGIAPDLTFREGG